MPNMLLEISGEITPERMKTWSQNIGEKNKTKQNPAVDVTADGNKLPCCKEQYSTGNWNVRLVHESRQIGSGQTGDGKSERQYSSNQ